MVARSCQRSRAAANRAPAGAATPERQPVGQSVGSSALHASSEEPVATHPRGTPVMGVGAARSRVQWFSSVADSHRRRPAGRAVGAEDGEVPNRLAAVDVPVPAAAPRQPRRLAGWGRPPSPRRGTATAGAAVGRVRRVPLVPRHGARVVRGPRGRGVLQRAVRRGEGRPRGASDVDAVYMAATQAPLATAAGR